jgi:UPF0716 protein FxsA
VIWRLLLLFTVVPALELFLLLQLGAWLGAWQTFLLVVVTGTVGAWLAKREGLGVLRQLSVEIQQGIPPGERLAEGLLVFAGGLLLVTPGVITDLTGVLFIFPPTRRWLAPRLVRAVTSRFDFASFGPGASSGRAPQNNPFASPFDDLP